MKAEVPFQTWLADATIRRVFKLPILERLLLRTYEVCGWRALLKGLPAHYAYPLGTWRICRRHGIRFEVDLGTRNGWMLYAHRTVNPEIARHVRPGETVLDIGANQGELSLYFAQAVKPGGRVYSFEPNPTMFATLSRNLELNPELVCQAEPLGLGSRTETVELRQQDGRNPGTATIHTEKVPCGGNWVAIQVVRLDDYVSAKDIPRIDAMKIDVEGYELEVCKGAEATLARFHPRLMMELTDELLCMHGASALELAEWLATHAYSIIDMATGAEVVPGPALAGCALNIVCTHRSSQP